MRLGVKVPEEADNFFEEMIYRLSNPAGFMFALRANIKKRKGYWVLDLSPNVPEFWKYGVLAFGLSIMLYESLGWLAIPGILFGGLIGMTGVFWSRWFYQGLLWYALRKKHPMVKPVFYSARKLRRLV